jgi:hypothetical protein
MDEKYIQDLYNQLGGESKFGAYNDFKDLIQNDSSYRKDFYNAFGENTLGAYNDFEGLVKKKGQSVTTELPSGASSLALPAAFPKPQDLPQGQGKPFEFNLDENRPIPKAVPKNAIQKTMDWVTGVGSEAIKSVTQTADDIINSSKNVLKEEGFFDDKTPESESTIFDFVKNKIGGAAQGLLLPGSTDAQYLIKKIINSSLSQEQKNKIINSLNTASHKVNGIVKGIEDYQKETLPQGNIPTEVVKGIVGMTPDLLLASEMGGANVESKLAKWAEKTTKNAAPLVQKLAPKAAKVLEESVVAPFTKIMAAKGALKGMAETEEGKSTYWNGIKGAVEGTAEGMYMHGLGVAAGKVSNPVARAISKAGVNSAISTAIATPLANAGVFATAKALRTAALEQRMVTGEELAMEAGTGLGFSLLHLGSQFKNQKDANNYYDNTLNDNKINSFSRIINETKGNIDLAYNPNLTEEQVINIAEARDDLKKAILKEPDMNKKKILGDEAIKLQNQLDAHFNIKGIIEDKDAIIDGINESGMTSNEKEFYINKVNAIADTYDMSDFAVKKRELDSKINVANKELETLSQKFTDLRTPSDRAFVKIKIDEKRAEIDGLNAELTNLITNKSKENAVQKQATDESVLGAKQPELELPKVGEGDNKPEVVTQQETITPEGTQEVEQKNTFTRESMNDISDGSGLVKKGEVFQNPEKVKSQLSKGDKIEFFAERKRTGVWDGDMIVEDGTGNRWGTIGILADADGYIKNLTKIESELKEKTPEVSVEEADIERRIQEELNRATRQDNGAFLNRNELETKRANAALDEWIRLKEKAKTDEELVNFVLESPLRDDIEEFINNNKFGQDAWSENYDKIRNYYVSAKDKINAKYDAELKALKEKQQVETPKQEGVGEKPASPEAKTLAEKIRAAKVGKGKAFDALLGIPVAIWDGSVELIAKTVEAGKSLGDAIKAGIKYIEANHKGKFDAKEYEREIKAGFISGYKEAMQGLQEDVDFAIRRKKLWEDRIEELTISHEKYKATDKYRRGDAKDTEYKRKIEEAKAERDTEQGNIDNAIDKLKDSDVYKNATDIEQEELVRDVRERFELKEKKAPSPEKLLGQPKPENVSMSMKDFMNKVVKAAKDGATSVAEAKKKIFDYFNSVKEYGNLTRKDILNITKIINEAKPTEEGVDKAVDKINEIIDKATTDIVEVSKAKIDKEKLKEGLRAAKEKAKSIAEAKKKIQDYFKSVKEYGNLTRSDLAKIAKEMMNVKDEESLNKAVDKINDIIDNATTDIIEISEAKMLRNTAKELKAAKKDLAERRKVFTAAIKNIEKSGKISSKQAGALIDKINKVNVESDEQMEKVIEFAEKVFSDAEYTDKLNKANDLKSSLLELSKSKDKDPYLKELATNFANINPGMVENIDTYNEMASRIKESLQGSKIIGGEKGVKPAEIVSIKEAKQYVDETMEAQRKKMYDDKLAAAEEAFGTDLPDMTYEQLVELMESKEPEDEKKKIEKETIIRDAIKRLFNSYSAIVDHIITTGKDPFTGETIDVSKSKKELLQRFMNMDMSKLDAKDALDAVDSLMNFIQNGSTSRMETVVRVYRGKEAIENLVKENNKRSENKKVIAKPLRLFYNKFIGKLFAEQFTNQNILLDKMFKGESKSAEFSRAAAITELKNKKTYVQAVINQMVEDYSKSFYKEKANGKDFKSQDNIVERGVIADLKRNIIGTAEEQQAEFNRKKRIIEQSIEALKNGNKEEKDLSKVYQRVYDKVLKDSKNAEDVVSKSDSKNVEAVDWWVKKWDEIYDQLKDVSENIHNEILDKELNYTTRKFTNLSEDGTQTEIPLGESLFHGNNNNEKYVYKKKTGVLEKVRPSKDLPMNKDKEPIMYRDLSFDKSQVNAMYDALIDINTSGIVRQVESFFKSKDLKKIIPDSEDRKILWNSVQDFVRNTRNKQIVNTDQLTKFARKLNTTSSIGVSAALGGVTQPLKQTIPVALNTLINANGRLNLGYYLNDAKRDFLDRAGYGISIRGRQSLADVQSVNKVAEAATKTAPQKGLEMIEGLSGWWLKTWLEKPDVFIARASWLSYYEKALKKQGVDLKKLDYSKDEVNSEAAEYAQRMVDRQQNISDKDLQGKFFRNKDNVSQMISKIAMPFANFRMNQTMRMISDLTTFTSKTASAEDRVAAAKSLAGFSVELASFKALAYFISIGVGSLTKSVMNQDETDEESEKRKSNALKAQVTGTVSDLFSPIPILDYPTVIAADKVMDLWQGMTGTEDKEKYHLFTGTKSGKDAIQSIANTLGVFGIAGNKAYDLGSIIYLINTGEYTDEYGRKKYISDQDKESLKAVGAMSLLSNFGLAPAEINTVTKNAVKFAKKNSSTKTPEEIRGREALLGGYENVSDMKRYDPQLYNETFGEGSEIYEAEQQIREAEKEKRQEERREKDEEMGYKPKIKRKPWYKNK